MSVYDPKLGNDFRELLVSQYFSTNHNSTLIFVELTHVVFSWGSPLQWPRVFKSEGQVFKLEGEIYYEDALNTTNLNSLKERRTQLCCKYIQKMTQNDHPINFLKPRTATSGHSYNLRASNNNRNIVYADRSCCRTQRSGSFISFTSK